MVEIPAKFAEMITEQTAATERFSEMAKVLTARLAALVAELKENPRSPFLIGAWALCVFQTPGRSKLRGGVPLPRR